MILGHQVLLDDALFHGAVLEFRGPFNTADSFTLPRRGRHWIWKVDFRDLAGDGLFNDVLVRCWHLTAPHLGEATNNAHPGHVRFNVGTAPAARVASPFLHRTHADALATQIIRKRGSAVWQLLIGCTHSRPDTIPTIEIPAGGGRVVPFFPRRQAAGR